MKINNLKISGFLSYQEEVEIDFTQFSLACITGENGSGKSSILDAITWALFGRARQSNESLINLQSEEAIVIFEFEYAGENYIIRRSNQRGKAARLTLKTPELDLTERTVRDTQNKIEQILKIDFDTFTHAVFFLQGESDQFVSASSGQRKQVLFDILGLGAWEEFRLSAAAEIKTIEKSMEQALGSVQVLEEGIARGDDVATDLEFAESEIPVFQKSLEIDQAALDDGQKKMDLWEAEKEELARLNSEGRKAQEKHDSIVSRIEEITATQEENYKIVSRKEQIVKDYSRSKEVNELLTIRQEKQIKHTNLSKDLAGLEADLEEIQFNRDEIPGLKENIKEWEAQAKEFTGHVSALDLEKEKSVKLDADIKNLLSKSSDLQDQITGLEGHNICPLCDQALDNPAELIGTLRAKEEGIVSNTTALREDFTDCQEERQRIINLLREVEGAEALIIPAKDRILRYERESEAFDHSKLDATRIAVGELYPYIEEIPDLRIEAERTKGAPRDHGLLEGAEKAGETLETQAVGLRQDLVDAEATVKDCLDQISSKESLKVENDITDNDLGLLKLDVSEAKAKLQAKTQRVGELNQMLKTIADQQAKLKEIKNQEKDNTDLHQKYSTLQEAFSKKGVPALLVEQALPQIESKANELLHRLSDGQMAVHFVTQKAYSDSSRDDMKETLDIEIQDQAGIRDYEMFSGGESFRINFAIRMALSHVLANRAGAKLRTLVIDEGFGSQDAGGRDRLINAINTVKEEYDKVLVITHIPEVIEAFPVQLRVEKTSSGSKVRMI